MIIKLRTSTCNGELVINEDANVHEYMDVIIGALMAEGFNIETIAEGFRSKLNDIDDSKE